MTDPRDAIEGVIRDEYARVLAPLIRVTGDVSLAEDALQDAVVRALESWPRDGVPREPRAWLIVAARRSAIDRIRREARRDVKEAAAMRELQSDAPEPPDSSVHDDLLRLVFTCCHPSLSLDAQVALSLRTLAGLPTDQVARLLLVSEATMAKRLTRAKQKIALARIPYRIPDDAQLPERLNGVLATIYLIFTQGYTPSGEGQILDAALCDEAIRLGRMLYALMPDEAPVAGLLALMLLHDSRRAARVDSAGTVQLLSEQDRNAWNADKIREGVMLVGLALRRSPDQPDKYVVQAAIAAAHALAPTYQQTSWDAIVSWYDVLLSIDGGPAARLARASAIAERDGPAAGLVEVDSISGLQDHAWWHGARAELLARLGRSEDARVARTEATRLGLHEAVLARLDESMS